MAKCPFGYYIIRPEKLLNKRNKLKFIYQIIYNMQGHPKVVGHYFSMEIDFKNKNKIMQFWLEMGGKYKENVTLDEIIEELTKVNFIKERDFNKVHLEPIYIMEKYYSLEYDDNHNPTITDEYKFKMIPDWNYDLFTYEVIRKEIIDLLKKDYVMKI